MPTVRYFIAPPHKAVPNDKPCLTSSIIRSIAFRPSLFYAYCESTNPGWLGIENFLVIQLYSKVPQILPLLSRFSSRCSRYSQPSSNKRLHLNMHYCNISTSGLTSFTGRTLMHLHVSPILLPQQSTHSSSNSHSLSSFHLTNVLAKQYTYDDVPRCYV
mmetsp:Transcript_22609/g.27286  ORF Transcript_22609/g.27286 Transcript_22609/m.27286 type:complete len:159 (+) Transcript_22609:380-856(+)